MCPVSRSDLPPVEGVLLAGGRSRRMGREKALIPAPDGRPLWRHQWDKLAALGLARLSVAVRAEQDWVPATIARRLDTDPDGGALPVLRDVARESSAGLVLVLAVDVPALPVAWLERLLATCSVGVGAVGVQPTADRRYEPLAAVYPCESLQLLPSSLGREQKALQPWVARWVAEGRLREVPIQRSEATWFRNWNTPEDVPQ